MTLFEGKIFFLYLADFWPFGNKKAHFSAWKVDLKFLKNHIWCSFYFLITFLPRFFGYKKKVKCWRWLLCRGWGSSGSFQPQAVALVMSMKQCGLVLTHSVRYVLMWESEPEPPPGRWSIYFFFVRCRSHTKTIWLHNSAHNHDDVQLVQFDNNGVTTSLIPVTKITVSICKLFRNNYFFILKRNS
jgi:hypothetical protein